MSFHYPSRMASGRRSSDYGEEFVERLRRDRFRKAYILVNGISSEEEDEELDLDEEDDEVASYALDPAPRQPPRPSSAHSSRRPPSIAASTKTVAGGAYGFTAQDLYYFGVLSELTDKFTPEKVARLVARSSPPYEYKTLGSIERVAYLFYYSLYGRYLNVMKFHNIFNREFYKYTCAGDTERNAFLKICRHTLEEYRRRIIEQNKRAYKMTQKQLFSDDRATPDSRASDRPSYCADGSEDLNSLDSLAKELMFYRSPHALVRFATGGRIIYVNPDFGMSTVCIEDVKRFYRDPNGRRYVEMLETFKGPLVVGQTPPQTPLLFIQRQIDRILQSDVYRGNPSSGDANDCLLIWYLLEMLVRQQGKVTGPDLARLLCSNQTSYHNSPLSSNSFLKVGPEKMRQDSMESLREVADPQAFDRVTRFLLGGHIDEAIESAINDGLLFDALMLANRLFQHDRRHLEAIEARLMAHRSAQHPVTTLLSVAANMPVPLLNNPTTDDANGWRAHIAIVLANLQTQTAMDAVYHLGLALSQKEFNSAADFCFLAVNLLTGYDCFRSPISYDPDEHPKHRKHIHLISASLPDDEITTCTTRFGWSILDYQATEIYDYAIKLGTGQSALANSHDFNQTKEQYCRLLDELGGFGFALEQYRENTKTASHTGSVGSFTTAQQQPQRLQQFLPPQQQQPFKASAPFANVAAEHNKMLPITDFDDGNEEEEEEIAFGQHRGQEKRHQRHRDWPAALDRRGAAVADKKRRESLCSRATPVSPILPQTPITTSLVLPPPGPLTALHFGEDEDEPLVSVTGGLDRQQHQQYRYRSDSTPSPPFHINTGASATAPNTNQQWFPTPIPFPPAPTGADGVSGAGGEPNDYVVRQQQQPPLPRLKQPEQLSSNASTTSKKLPSEKSKKDDGGSGTGGRLFGGISGLFSKIKPQNNEMRLPDDKNPKIIWDPHLGRYVDQESKDEPPEELPPPPISVDQQSPNEPYEVGMRDTSTPIQQIQMNFPQIEIPSAITSAAPSKSGAGGPRPFQGRARYANAWESSG